MGLHFHDPGALPFSRKIFRPREPRGYSHTRLRSRPCSLSDGEYGNWPNAWRTTFPFIRIRLIFRLSSRHPIAPNLPGFYRPPRPIQVLTNGFLTRHTPMALIFLEARLEKPRPYRRRIGNCGRTYAARANKPHAEKTSVPLLWAHVRQRLASRLRDDAAFISRNSNITPR